jgi:hypothetical protein
MAPAPPNRLGELSSCGNFVSLPPQIQKSWYSHLAIRTVTYAAPMPESSDRIQLLGKPFESLTLKLAEAQSLEERTKVLRQMKVLIVEIDMVILSSLRRDDQDSTNAVPHDCSTTAA